MPMPKLEYINCIGFPREFLPVIIQAIDGKMVTWGKSSGFCASFSTNFTFADCEWVVDELNEYIVGIKLVSGKIDSEDLTVAVLKGKIEIES